MKITATNLQRHMNCNGSAKMNTPEFKSEQNVEERDKGVAADWVIKLIHEGVYSPEECVGLKASNGVFITAEMVSYLKDYIDTLEGYETEVNTDWNDSLDCQITGRADRIKFDFEAKHLFIDDFKYGFKIVEPENNWTLISHAIGWYIQTRNNDQATPIVEKISMSIYQPRASHFLGRIRTHTISFDQLLEYSKQIVEAVKNPKDILTTGQHCYKCPFNIKCPASRKAQNNGIDATEKLYNEEITNDELDYELDHLERAMKVLKERHTAYEELAVSRLKKGQVITNRSLDTRLGNTSWKKDVSPEFIEMVSGKTVTEKKIVTPTQAKNVYGVPEEVIAPFTERAVKGVKMVRIDANTKAQKIFNQ